MGSACLRETGKSHDVSRVSTRDRHDSLATFHVVPWLIGNTLALCIPEDEKLILWFRSHELAIRLYNSTWKRQSRKETIVLHFSTHNFFHRDPIPKLKLRTIPSNIPILAPLLQQEAIIITSDNTLRRQLKNVASSADELHENHAMAGKGASYFSTSYYESRMEQHVMQRHFS